MKALHKKLVLLTAAAILVLMSGTPKSEEEPAEPYPPIPGKYLPEPLPYFEDLLTYWEIAKYGYKYRPLFDNPKILNALRTRERVPHVDWDSELQLRLLRTIFTYDANNGNIHISPDYTEYSERFMQDQMPDFEMGIVNMPPNAEWVQYMRFNDEYEAHRMINHMAWHLFIEANHLVPWSLTDLPDEALSVLY